MLNYLAFSKTIIFVKPNGIGDGSSWKQAIGNLDQALNQATYGSKIWVAAGTYPILQIPMIEILLFYSKRRENIWRKKKKKNFSGKESNFHQRQPLLNQTILSGEIGLLPTMTMPIRFFTLLKLIWIPKLMGFILLVAMQMTG